MTPCPPAKSALVGVPAAFIAVVDRAVENVYDNLRFEL